MNDDVKSKRIKMIENNVAAFFAVWKDFKGAEFVNDHTGTQIVTGLPFAYMNSVVNANYREDVTEQIRKTLKPFEKKKVPVLWWIGPNSKPDDLEAYLEKFDFRKVDEPPGMYMNLDDLDQNYEYPTELRIEEVNNEQQLEEWTSVFKDGMGGNEELRLAQLRSETHLLQIDNYITFIGYWDDEPVATAALVLEEDVAGVYLIITVPEHRGKKIGSAVTIFALKHAYELGYREAILQSSAMGFNIYKRIGFEEYCKFKWYYRKFE